MQTQVKGNSYLGLMLLLDEVPFKIWANEEILQKTVIELFWRRN